MIEKISAVLGIFKLIKGVWVFFSSRAKKQKHYFVVKTIDDGKKLYVKNIGETAKNILIRTPPKDKNFIYFNWGSEQKEPFSLESGQGRELPIRTRKVITKMKYHKQTNSGLKGISWVRRLIPLGRQHIWQSAITSIFHTNALIKAGIKNLKIELSFQSLDNTKHKKYYLSQAINQEWMELK